MITLPSGNLTVCSSIPSFLGLNQIDSLENSFVMVHQVPESPTDDHHVPIKTHFFGVPNCWTLNRLGSTVHLA